MLNELARELGQPEITKAPEDQRIRLLLEALRTAQALLILDNLESLAKEDRDQLFTFVKRLPQGCKAILTSRRRIGSGSELLILEELDQAAALRMLADLARHNPLLAKTSEADRISLYEQTGGKPLLLRWIAGQLGRGSCRTIGDALRTSSAVARRGTTHWSSSSATSRTSSPRRKHASSWPSPTSPSRPGRGTSPSWPALDEDRFETALRTLANRSLVVPDQEETAYALVPMVADFLRRKRPEVVAETGNRLEQRAYALIVENGYNKHDRFPVLDANWPTAAPALPLFVAGPNDRLQTVCDALHFLGFHRPLG